MPYTVPKLTDFSTAALDSAVRDLVCALDEESKAVRSETEWKTFHDRWTARKNGIKTQIGELWLSAAPKEAKREVGRRVNLVIGHIETAVKDTDVRRKNF